MSEVNTSKSFIMKKPIIWLILIIALYLVLLIPTVSRYGITVDEQTDMSIARSYISQGDGGGWLKGSQLDTTQTRLPMYLGAIFFYLFNNTSLLFARFLSCCMGVFTLIGVYLFCSINYDKKTGLAACLMLAISPFFLSFSRVAFTETDIYLSCFFIWFLISFSFLLKQGTLGWTVLTAVILGLAVSSKFTAVAAFLCVILALVLYYPREELFRGINSSGSRRVFILSILSLMILAIPFFKVGIAYSNDALKSFICFTEVQYLIILISWILVILWAALQRNTRLNPAVIGVFILAFSSLTFMLIPPVHSTNPKIFKGILYLVLVKTMEGGAPAVIARQLGCVIFKSTPVLGVWLLISFCLTAINIKHKKEAIMPVLLCIFYFIIIAVNPANQPFYMMPLLPVLSIFAVDRLFDIYKHKRFAGVVITFLIAFSVVFDVSLCYPDYNLNGYQWIGPRYLFGKTTIGARGIVNIPNDGVEQTLRWANSNVKSGEKVYTYFYKSTGNIVNELNQGNEFTLINGMGKPENAFMEADYVITNINGDVIRDSSLSKTGSVYGYPYNLELLKENYIEVYSVKRKFGLKPGIVWRRKTLESQYE